MGLLDKIFDNDKNKRKNEPRATSAPAPAPAAPAPAAPRADTPRADFSDVRGASSTTAPADTPRPAARTYTVKAGDSLSKIAQRELGDGTKWRAIFEANRDKIKDPDLIHPGQVLTLPSA